MPALYAAVIDLKTLDGVRGFRINGDGAADFGLHVDSATALTASDFIL